jgi:chemotaxis-related protein WspB
MLFLVFELGADRYALDARQVAEVLPLLAVKRIPQAPPAIQGLFNYRGAPVPAVDLSQLILGRPAARLLSTRIVVVHYPGDNGRTHLLGLIVEKATQTARHEPSAFAPFALATADAPYLGPVVVDAHGLLQWVDARALLPPAFGDLLFNEPVVDDRWCWSP